MPLQGLGLEKYLRHVGSVLAEDRGLSAAVEASRGVAGSPPRGETLARIEEAIQVLIDDARTAGTVRPDLTPNDIYLIIGGISAAISTDSGNWRRLLTLTLEGIRPR